jgi:hypothetical protein
MTSSLALMTQIASTFCFPCGGKLFFFLSFQLYMKAGSGNGKKHWGGSRVILLPLLLLFILIFASDLFTFVGLASCTAQNVAGRLHFPFSSPFQNKNFPRSRLAAFLSVYLKL